MLSAYAFTDFFAAAGAAAGFTEAAGFKPAATLIAARTRL
jgi:hypothetical protein